MDPIWLLVLGLAGAIVLFAVIFLVSRGARQFLDSAAFRVTGRPGVAMVLAIPGGTGHAYEVFLRWALRWEGDASGDELRLRVTVTLGEREIHTASFVVGDDEFGTPLPVGSVRGLDASVTSTASSGRIRQADAVVRLEPWPAGIVARVAVIAEPRPSANMESIELLAVAVGP